MFISYQYKYLGYKNGERTWGYEIIDSEFRTSSGVINIEKKAAYVIDTATAVIQEYSKRKLNVAANLAIAFVWLHKLYPYYSVQDLINYNKKYNPLFQQYEEDLNKYLVLF
jgi:hypothetical protein